MGLVGTGEGVAITTAGVWPWLNVWVSGVEGTGGGGGGGGGGGVGRSGPCKGAVSCKVR